MVPNTTYQVIDKVGEIYNLPAEPEEFILVNLAGTEYLSSDGSELVENSNFLRPFRPEGESNTYVYSIGVITTTDNTVEIPLHSSGYNTVIFNGVSYPKSYPDLFYYTPVTTGIKSLIIYALPTAQIFYLAEGAEGTEAVDPELPAGALLVSRIIATTDGQEIDPGILSGFQTKEEKNWKNIMLATASATWLGVDGDRSSIWISMSPSSIGVSGFNIKGIKNTGENNIYPGKEFLIFNASSVPVTLLSEATAGTNEFPFSARNNPKILKPNQSAICKISYTGDKLEVIGVLTAGTEFSLTAGRLTKANSSGNNITDSVVFEDTSGNVGVGTASPTEKMEVNGNVKANQFIYNVTTANTVPNKTWTDGKFLMFTNTLGINKAVRTENVFVYTPTGNFTISAIKTAVENAGLIFNDIHIIINLGSSNYTCSIDIGAANPNNLFTITRTGTGSLSFSSTRTLNAGDDNITIMNGNESSMALVQMRSTIDFLTIINK